MKRTDLLQDKSVEAIAEKRLWIRAFAISAAIEACFVFFAYVGYKKYCVGCPRELPYFLTRGIMDVVFTAGVWYLLFRLHQLKFSGLPGINAFVFLVYAGLWLIFRYSMESSTVFPGNPAGTPGLIFRLMIYESWFDLGKYVLKVSAFYVLRFYFAYRRAEQKKTEMAMINKEMQLHLLKQQLSPHFYFNTLNNLYGLARNDSPLLGGALQQLSNIMQYVIHDCNQPRVFLAQEISFLQSYIALEKLRYEEDTVIDIQVQGDVNGQAILPLLLIQFVENAFKHGMNEKSERSWMRVNVRVEGKELFFSVDNSNYQGTASGGVGLSSVRHRLDLQYPDRYRMNISQTREQFSVQLSMQLSSN